MMEILLSNISGTIVFIIVLSVLIVVHEWGHFITAKKCGVEVKEFALGFGPTLWSKMYNGTNYLVKLYPLGGYVKMAGDERATCKGTPKEFYSQSIWKRSWIVFNGPFVNFIFAYICFVFVFMLGYPDLSTKVESVVKGYPAVQAGMMPNDVIKKIDGVVMENWTDVQLGISESTQESLEILVDRDGEDRVLVLIPRIEKTKDIFGQMKLKRFAGIKPAREVISLKYNFSTAPQKSWEKLAEIVTKTYQSLWAMITGSGKSPKESLTGPIGIFLIIKSAAELGLSNVLFIMGIISVSLAIFNLFPIIPLDGGHLFLMGIEKIKGSPLPEKVEEYIVKFGFLLIMMLALFVFYNDFDRIGLFEWIKNIFS